MKAQKGREKELEKKRMQEILRVLKREYPESECSLRYESPFQLLIATILSAQCTDARVNQVTPALFKKYPRAQEMAKADLRDIEKLIQSTGFYRNKAQSILASSQIIAKEYGGEIPQTLDQLIRLRGVGRKTANVVLGVAYGKPGLVVDTHVGRISRRMGFTASKDPVKVEQEMTGWVPESDWILYAHLLIDHGRKVCTARKARCEECVIARYCPKIGVNLEL